MRLFQHIIRAFREGYTSYTYDLVADGEFGWEDEDGKRLLEFFGSTTGRRLKARLTNYVCRAAVEATRHENNTKYHNGLVRGISSTITVIEEHFASPVRNTDNSETEQQSSVADGLALL